MIEELKGGSRRALLSEGMRLVGGEGAAKKRSLRYASPPLIKRFKRELLDAEEAVLRLRSEGKIGDEVMRRIEGDLEDSRLET